MSSDDFDTFGMLLEANNPEEGFRCVECGSKNLSHLALLLPCEKQGEDTMEVFLPKTPIALHYCIQCWPKARVKLEFLGMPHDPDKYDSTPQ